ncbi:polyubiquitin-like isoform X2 [Gadus chalcogrammus]|uniref:polyubiquitin-like isoform X2 n=1 Tax=Gadus chalcogrammus TaxID=1042646 RepID=UPI0024C34910|nr:polyubiquitin-like isoform X2 [Gadus chalcogrammus]
MTRLSVKRNGSSSDLSRKTKPWRLYKPTATADVEETSFSPSRTHSSYCSSKTLTRQLVMDITITLLNGESHPLTVAPGTTVGSLKDLLSQRSRLSPESQKLFYDNDGEKIILDDTMSSLSAYGVSPGANIFVLAKEPANIQVFLTTVSGQIHTYTVRPGETVAGFKLKVKQREKVAEDQQRLMHESKQMDDGSRTLESYNVKEGSTIYLNGRLRGG